MKANNIPLEIQTKRMLDERHKYMMQIKDSRQEIIQKVTREVITASAASTPPRNQLGTPQKNYEGVSHYNSCRN